MLADLWLGQKVPDGFLHLRIAELSIAHNAKGQVVFFISPHSFYIGRIHGAIKHPHKPTGNGNLIKASQGFLPSSKRGLWFPLPLAVQHDPEKLEQMTGR
ncbi:MAG: hypothetical protein WAO21_01695 [Verrucomicrobiia bacterium]